MTTFEAGDRVRFTPPGFRRAERTGEVFEVHTTALYGTDLYIEDDEGRKYKLPASAAEPVQEIRTDGGVDDLHKLLDGVREGHPTKHQIDPDEADPVCGETADEAEESLKRTGLVNPFHAAELQRRQTERRRELRENEPNPIIAELEKEDDR